MPYAILLLRQQGINRSISEGRIQNRFSFLSNGALWKDCLVWPSQIRSGLHSMIFIYFEKVVGKLEKSKETSFLLLSIFSLHFSPSPPTIQVVIGGINVDFIAKARNPTILVLYLKHS